MPTITELQAKSSTPLNDLEREIVRQIIGIDGKSDSATYIESESRMGNLTASQCQIVRGLFDVYDDVNFDSTSAVGGQKGINFNPQRDLDLVADELRRLLYPENFIPDDTSGLVGVLGFVPVDYSIGPQDEFS